MTSGAATGWLYERRQNIDPIGPVHLPAELRRLVRLSFRPWFDRVAPAPLAGQCGAMCEVIVETFFALRDLGAFRRMVDRVGVKVADEDVYEDNPDFDGLVHSLEHAGWLTPQAAALRTCLRRIEHACALQVLSESWS